MVYQSNPEGVELFSYVNTFWFGLELDLNSWELLGFIFALLLSRSIESN